MRRAGVSGLTRWVDVSTRGTWYRVSRRFRYLQAGHVASSRSPSGLRALLLDPNGPFQLVFAGKAHPATLGKQMIAELVRFSRDPQLRPPDRVRRDYDIAIAAMLYQGSDVWLNTLAVPWRPAAPAAKRPR